MIALLTVPGMTVSPPFIADLSGDCRADLTDLSSMIAYMTIPGGITLKPGC
jgi:hypothetical protein